VSRQILLLATTATVFLIREVLGITGIALPEMGSPGGGALSGLVVPEGKWC